MNEYNDYNQISFKDKMAQFWYKYRMYIMFLIFIIIVVFIIFLMLKNKSGANENSKYTAIESIMIYNAQKYIKNNNILQDSYLSLNYLNISIDKKLNCNSGSGVLVKKGKYIPYLLCNEYNSNTIKESVDNNEKIKEYGFLKGDNPYILSGGNYQEPGYVIDAKYTVNVTNTKIKNGINVIKYNILEKNKYIGTLERIVIADEILGQEPTIELVGNYTRTINKNSIYIESGYKAIDQTDGDITDKVTISGAVDTKTIGTYVLTYSVTNTRGLTTKVKRTVIVNDNEINLTINHTINPTIETESGVTISLNIVGNGYEKTILPNNEESTLNSLTYTVQKNGSYEFLIYDKNGNSEVYSVNITNAVITYKIVYDKNGGDTGPTTQTKYKNKEITLSNSLPTYSGYTFIEWNSKKDQSGNVYIPGDTYALNEDLTLYAIWIKNTDIKYWETGLVAKKYRNEAYNESMSYYFYAPPNTMTIKKMPLIIYLHGSGEGIGQGDGTIKVLRSAALPKLLYKNQIAFNAIMVAPHTVGTSAYSKETSSGGPIKRFIDYLVKTYNIDPKRIAITGHSIGARETLMLVQSYPDYFSCAVPLSANYSISNAAYLTSIPIWGFTGDRDGYSYPIFPNLVDAINQKGGNAKITILKGQAHGITETVYGNKEVIDWMLNQIRK